MSQIFKCELTVGFVVTAETWEEAREYARGAEMMLRRRGEAPVIVAPTSIRRSVGPGEPIPGLDTKATPEELSA